MDSEPTRARADEPEPLSDTLLVVGALALIVLVTLAVVGLLGLLA